ncbi:type-2 ice-structuring protein-like [Cheilinus undulatus]|uniref:type-2 ice-structuring protein-like n=1 Tax=Cheilinus undulatus TaxID=241271 RepID=UPI001BD657F0|nr:type-2 ice-structuring protein-like [Cheilinus undulatus]
MKLLAVSALVCAVVVLTNAAAYHDLFKRQSGEWTVVGNHQYLYVEYPQTWTEAEQNCHQLGGHLASVHSHFDNHQIRLLVTRMTGGNPEAWLGGSDQYREGNWGWNDGSSWNFKNWCNDQPNNSGDQDCLQMNHSSDHCWNDWPCSTPLPSVCGKPK